MVLPRLCATVFYCSIQVPKPSRKSIEQAMLRLLARGQFSHIGALLAAMAIGSFVAPPMAIALAPTPAAVHCVTHVNHHDSHADTSSAAAHSHDKASKGNDANPEQQSGGHPDQDPTCCEMFNVTGLNPSLAPGILTIWHQSDVSVIVHANFQSLTPDQPSRPPNYLFSTLATTLFRSPWQGHG